MFVSTIVATIGRKSQNRVVKSALSQGLADGDYEVIVVKDLCRKVVRIGDFVQTSETVAGILRGQTDTTTNYKLAT